MDITLAQNAVEHLMEMPNFLFLALAAIGVVAIVAGAITKIVCTAVQEKTRREMAAYVAEGSIEPDKAIALLSASPKEA